MNYTTDIRVLLRHINRASEFLRWLQEDGDHLIASADLLGGPNWARRARSVVKAAREGRDLSARREALKGLHHFLHLDLVQDLKLDLSRFSAAPGARLSHLSFEGDRTFPAQC